MADGPFSGARFSADRSSVEFRVLAPHATHLELWVYRQATQGAPLATLSMTASTDGTFWTVLSLAPLLAQGLSTVYYGYRAWGPNWTYDAAWHPGSGAGFLADVDQQGNRFNPNKLLLDPYALEVSHDPLTPGAVDLTVYQSGATSRLVDTGPLAPKGIVIDVLAPDFGTKPTRAFKDEIVYEVHLRGLSKTHPAVPQELCGTYAGAAILAPYLRDLGVTAVEFLPVHELQNALNDSPELGHLHDYWGYDSVSYFSPCRRYAHDQSPGGPTREFLSMVKAFHDVGLKVYLDVVYNHHEEGVVDNATGTVGEIYSLRGLANPDYYETLAADGTANFYQNDNGVSPNVNAATTAVRNLVLASLHYYSGVLGVDGFRFDLAAVLGNSLAHGGYQFDRDDPDNILNRCVQELPARPAQGGPGVDLIAEPYTAGPAGGGQQQGNFPVGWAEWNDRYRDTIRASQNKLGYSSVTPGQLATRLAGSDDLFRARGRHPWSSVNYVTSHDGFTLRDLHSFNAPSNRQPPPFGPSDGGRSANDEMGWDHGGVLADQKQAERTSLALLVLSAGVPMLTGGSELRRTIRGNNNPYNLDTVANWLDWSQQTSEADMVLFVKRLLQFRSAHPALRPFDFFTGQDLSGTGAKDLTWYRDDGGEVDINYFNDPNRHFLAYALDGVVAKDSANRIYVAYNGWVDPVRGTLPPLRWGTRWYQVADTSAGAAGYGYFREPGAEAAFDADAVSVAGRSVMIFIAR